MSFSQEFKTFALKGNVVDLAVGVIVGAAFAKMVDALVADVIMPLVGMVFGGLDFANNYIALSGQTAHLPLEEAKKLGAVFAYGHFITVTLNFFILAFIVFMMVHQINQLTVRQSIDASPEKPAETPEDVLLLREIRDSLQHKV